MMVAIAMVVAGLGIIITMVAGVTTVIFMAQMAAIRT